MSNLAAAPEWFFYRGYTPFAIAEAYRHYLDLLTTLPLGPVTGFALSNILVADGPLDKMARAGEVELPPKLRGMAEAEELRQQECKRRLVEQLQHVQHLVDWRLAAVLATGGRIGAQGWQLLAATGGFNLQKWELYDDQAAEITRFLENDAEMKVVPLLLSHAGWLSQGGIEISFVRPQWDRELRLRKVLDLFAYRQIMMLHDYDGIECWGEQLRVTEASPATFAVLRRDARAIDSLPQRVRWVRPTMANLRERWLVAAPQ